MDAPALHRFAPARHADETRPLIVKLGGSVIRSPDLTAWLDVIAATDTPLVIVPGGGALADEVRSCQSQLGFGDTQAHRMALLAMDQLAWAVAGLRPEITVGTTEEALLGIIGGGQVAVWAPYTLIADRTDMEATWRLTSDSLALWLGAKLGARCCYIIKSIDRQHTEIGAEALARDGIVDEAFPAMLAETGVATRLLGRGDQQALAAALAGDNPCGAAIE